MIAYWIGKAWLKVFGWRLEGEHPEPPKFVLIAAPHTSNWDVPFMLATAYVLGVDISWLGKHTLFEGPFGGFMRWLGGIPVDRRASHNVVSGVIDLLNKSDKLILAVSPEGTRGASNCWKSGFYHMANGAHVPIGLGFLDFERKVCGLGPFVTPTGNIRADMDKVRAFYGGIRGKYPHMETVPRLREELETATVAA